MYRVRYLEQNDKMSQQVRLSMFEQVYERALLQQCALQSVTRAQKARRVRHFTALSVLWFVLAMVLLSRLAQGRVWDKLTHWLQDRDPARPQEPAGASALSYQREQLGVEPVKQLFEQGPQVSRGMLLRHDANFFGGAYLEALNAKGVRALFALPSTVALQRRRNLPDGSYLALLKPHAKALYPMQRPVWLRVIEYPITDERLGEQGQVYRLGTTWLNPRTAPAKELLVLSHERWEIEIVIDEIKTHLRVQQKVLRSHTPEGERQELYALFVVHYAIRALMYRSA